MAKNSETSSRFTAMHHLPIKEDCLTYLDQDLFPANRAHVVQENIFSLPIYNVFHNFLLNFVLMKMRSGKDPKEKRIVNRHDATHDSWRQL